MRSLRHVVCRAVLLSAVASLGCTAKSSGTLSAFSGGGGPYTLTLNKVGGAASGTVTSNPTGISCGTSCTTTNHAFATGTNVVLTAAAAGGYTFNGWSGSGINCPGTGTCTVAMGVARTVTATFTQNSATQYTLQVSKAGTGTGTVTSAPAGISCGADCSQVFDAATVVTLSAAAAGGSSFTGWNGGGCSGTGTCTVTMSTNRTVTATFASTGPYTLTVTKTGQGTVTSDPAGISCGADCSQAYADGTDVVLTAAGENGYTFAGWSGSGVSCPGTGTCTVTMSAARSVLARFTSGDIGDLCDGLVTDQLNRPRTNIAKPVLGAAYLDPNFGTTIRRITNSASYSSTLVIKPVYSTIQAWNADESYLVLYHTETNAGHHLYMGKAPYSHIKELNISPADLEQVYWSPTDPKVIYYTNITEKRLYAFNVDTEARTLVKDFSLAPVSCNVDITGGSDPMWTSWDGGWFGYTCGRSESNTYFAQKMYAYNRLTDTIGAIFVDDTDGNAPQPAPSGTLFLLNPADGYAQVRDANMNLLRTLTVAGGEHGTVGTSDGVDTFFSTQFDVEPYGNVIAVNMANGNKRVIIGDDGVPGGWPDYPARGAHLSAVAYQNPGWLVMDAVGEGTGQTLLDNEVVLINANTGGSICRIGHHHSCGSASNGGDACDTPGQQGYWAEPHATISPTGTRVLFASDWRGESRVETYVIELPSYRP